MRTLAVLSLLIVTGLWVFDRGSAPEGIAAAGRLCALWSTDLLLIQVVLMARVPWVERAFGQDTLARWHRVTGFASFDLLVAHLVLASIAATRRAGNGVGRQL